MTLNQRQIAILKTALHRLRGVVAESGSADVGPGELPVDRDELLALEKYLEHRAPEEIDGFSFEKSDVTVNLRWYYGEHSGSCELGDGGMECTDWDTDCPSDWEDIESRLRIAARTFIDNNEPTLP